jgi:6-phosphogluconolactonase (cycloisomerase 2 family)
VYVASSNGSTDQIEGYAAASNGSLTAIPGSPFPYNVNYMAVNGAWLFGVANVDEDLYSFSIGANGALTVKDKLRVVTNGDGLISDYLDHTGATLYADLYSTNNDYLSYSIDQSTGKLTQTGDLAGGPPNNSPVSFIGNNEFAYSSSCYHFGPEIIGVRRNTDGTLSCLSNFNPPYPKGPAGDFWCPWLVAADPTDHLAIAMQPLNGNWVIQGAISAGDVHGGQFRQPDDDQHFLEHAEGCGGHCERLLDVS